ncbi:MAG: HAD family hydrolase [Treponemataceae bacterium]|nr:HAD family hydrolase [Treponemataceae bacterium]
MSKLKSHSEIKAVVFDIDGTLYPNSRLYKKMWFYFLKNLRFFMKYNKVRRVLHKTAVLPDFFEYQGRMLAAEMNISKEKAKSLIEEKVYKGLEPFFVNLKPFNYVKETFENFKSANIKLGILSDFPPEQKKDIWGTAPLCDVIMGSEQCGALKPSIYTFGTLIKKLDLPAENILYVGNSISSDVKGAKSAGMQTAYLAPTWKLLFKKLPKEADFSFRNYRKLQEYVLE